VYFSDDLAHGKSCQYGANAQTADLTKKNKSQNCGDQQADYIKAYFDPGI
jgi:hypothetical protein